MKCRNHVSTDCGHGEVDTNIQEQDESTWVGAQLS
jgi:hypothetical protein